MIGSELIKAVAQKVRIWDRDAGDVVDNSYYSRADILEVINRVYRERIFPLFKSARKHRYEREAVFKNYESDTTLVSQTTTSIVTTDAIFTDGHVGATLYNLTKTEYGVISSYVSATNVILQESPASTWDSGDVIYLITGFVELATGNTIDLIEVEDVFIKYASTDTQRRRVERGYSKDTTEDFYPDPTRISSFDPWFEPVVKNNSSGGAVVGINISPIWIDTILEDGILIKYTQFPPAITETSEPELPKGHHEVIVFGAAKEIAGNIGFSKLQLDEMAMDFQGAKNELRSFYNQNRVVQRKPVRHNDMDDRSTNAARAKYLWTGS